MAAYCIEIQYTFMWQPICYHRKVLTTDSILCYKYIKFNVLTRQLLNSSGTKLRLAKFITFIKLIKVVSSQDFIIIYALEIVFVCRRPYVFRISRFSYLSWLNEISAWSSNTLFIFNLVYAILIVPLIDFNAGQKYHFNIISTIIH